MIRYNWNKILKESKSKVSDILLVTWYITYNYPPTSKRDRLFKFYGKDYTGDSFLVNPEAIYKYRKTASDSEWAADKKTPGVSLFPKTIGLSIEPVDKKTSLALMYHNFCLGVYLGLSFK